MVFSKVSSLWTLGYYVHGALSNRYNNAEAAPLKYRNLEISIQYNFR
jgi:hypothetical protein